MQSLTPHPLPLAMLCVGKRRFVPSAQALVDSLFLAGGTADGIFKVRANGVLFCAPNGEPVAFLVANPAQDQFFVTAFKHLGRRAFVSRRSYLFRVALHRRLVNEELSLDLCRALWRVASSKARVVSTS